MARVWRGNSATFNILFKASSYLEAFFIGREETLRAMQKVCDFAAYFVAHFAKHAHPLTAFNNNLWRLCRGRNGSG